MGAPVRMCLACRARGPQETLLRLGVQDGTVTVVQPAGPGHRQAQVRPPGARPSEAARAAPRRTGRGAYLCPATRCAEAGLRRDAEAVLRALRLRRGDAAVDADAIRAAVRPDGTSNGKSQAEAIATAAGRRAVAARGACT